MKIRFLSFVLSFFMFASPAFAENLIITEVVGHGLVFRGDNDVVRAETGVELASGSLLVVGKGVVSLTASQNRIAVKAEDEAVVGIDQIDPEGMSNVEVQKGLVDFEIVPGNKLDVKTPHMLASVRGTAFTTEVSPLETVLSVREGVVQAQDNEGQSETVAAGSSVSSTKNAFKDRNRTQNQQRNNPQQAQEKGPKGEKGEGQGQGKGQGGGQGWQEFLPRGQAYWSSSTVKAAVKVAVKAAVKVAVKVAARRWSGRRPRRRKW